MSGRLRYSLIEWRSREEAWKLESILKHPSFQDQKKAKYYVSYCPILDVWTQGETAKKAFKNLAEALQLFLMSCYERGILDKVLKESGFIPAKRPGAKKKKSDEPKVDVLLPFTIDSRLARCQD